MPTENRSSHTEMVSVPRELTPEMREVFHSSYESYEDGQRECPGSQWQAILSVAPRPAPQPHPDPIAWVVGTAFWWTKEEAERDAAETGLPIVPVGPLPASPHEYCLMPKRLTAENGAKARLLGEFKLEVTQECSECRELDEPAEGCEICDGEGEYGQRHTIPWDMIKLIYSEAVKGLALKQ
ncbi:hypothetical protein ACIF8Z_10330 [Pseudomonas promysalinigenes]|uniref:hypothetical protein n=1 Tax=Pseudomonas promysalinigenes TaxID=485898 RepID=UPI0037C6AE6F